jgi:peptidoglycan LD-endopeptidase CwlK
MNPASTAKLKGVHPDLIRVIVRADADNPGMFVVGEGTRTLARQRQLLAAGASKTLRSRHIPATSKKAPQYGHAVDLLAAPGGKIRWDWPLYHAIAKAVKAAAKAEGVAIEWGGDWKTFKDGPHWQLPWSRYP